MYTKIIKSTPCQQNEDIPFICAIFTIVFPSWHCSVNTLSNAIAYLYAVIFNFGEARLSGLKGFEILKVSTREYEYVNLPH